MRGELSYRRRRARRTENGRIAIEAVENLDTGELGTNCISATATIDFVSDEIRKTESGIIGAPVVASAPPNVPR